MRTKLGSAWIVLWMILLLTGGARMAAAAGVPRSPVSIDDLELQVATQVPAFGGMFLDANKALNIYLTDTRQAAAAETAIASVFGRTRFDMTHARVLVTTAPLTNPPAVTILNPLKDFLLDLSTPVTLSGKAQDPGGSALTYQWVLTQGPTQTVLGTGSAASGGPITLRWKPSDNVSFTCGGSLVTLELDVTNASAKTGKAFVTVTVGYPPC